MIYHYDGTKEKCPIPLVQTRLLLKQLTPGDTCMLMLKDTGSIKDIPKLLLKQGYSYSQTPKANGIIEICIQAKHFDKEKKIL